MIIPEKLKVLGHEYKVTIDDKVRRHHSTSGTCCINTNEIDLEAGGPESKQAETFLHEIFEAIKYHLDLGDDLEHRTLSQLSKVLFAVIRDNDLDFRRGK